MLAAVIKITSKLSLAHPWTYKLFLLFTERANANINFTIYGQQTHSHKLSQSQTDFRARKHVLPLHILHIFLFALLWFLRVLEQQKIIILGGEFIVLQFNFPWFPGLEFGVFIFVKTIVFTP